MKIFRKVCMAFLLIVLLSSATCAKSYTIDRINIRSEILPDGSLIIEETRSYNFTGKFSWADYRVPLKGLGTVTDIELYDGTTRMVPDQKSKAAGSYQVYLDKKKLYIRWYYQAKNEKRQFTIRYRVEDAVTVYNDVADFYYKFVSRKNEKQIGRIDVTTKLLYDADTSRVRAWVHGPLSGTLAFEDGLIHAWAEPLPKRRFFETRIIFPPEWIPRSGKFVDKNRQGAIMDQERKWAEKANAQRMKVAAGTIRQEEFYETARYWNIVAVIVALMLIATIYWKWGRGFKVNYYERITSSLPKDISPALANYIYNAGNLDGGALVATMLELARWSYLTIEDKNEGNAGFFSRRADNIKIKLNEQVFDEDKEQLKDHELALIQLLFGEIADEEPVITLKQVRKAGSKVRKWFATWKKQIKTQWGNQPIYDRQSIKAMLGAMGIGICLMAIGIFTLIRYGDPGLIGLFGSIFAILISIAILRYTQQAKLLRSQLAAYRRYLNKYHFREMQFTKNTPVEEFLIYGIALGISPKATKLIVEHVPTALHTAHFPWYIAMHHQGDPTQFASTLSRVLSTVATNMSSAAGIGGGASAGGGGGAGGASGGAG